MSEMMKNSKSSTLAAVLALLLIASARGSVASVEVAHASGASPEKVSDIGYFVANGDPFGNDYEDRADRMQDLDGAGTVVFRADEASCTDRLWSTSGPSTQMRIRDDLWGYPLVGGGNGSRFVAIGSCGNGPPLLLGKTDGTAAGTVLVKAVGVQGLGLGNLNGEFFFTGNDATSSGLWKSDGTTAGTVFLSSLGGGQAETQGGGWVAGGHLFFDVHTSSHRELWRTDGTSLGTVLLETFSSGSESLQKLGVIGESLLFSAIDGNGDEGLWASDGTPAGTELVTQLSISNAPDSTYVRPSDRVLNGNLYFGACTAIHGCELWKTDGTAAGTVMVKDINPGTGHGISSAAPWAVLGGVLLFAGNEGTTGLELWSTDGTLAGTSLVKDINPTGSSLPGTSSSRGAMVTVGNVAFFQAKTPNEGWELWRTDGTVGGTVLTGEVCPGNCTVDTIQELTVSGGAVYFVARSEPIVIGVDNGGYDVWRIPAPTDTDTDGMSDDFESGYGGATPEDSLVVSNPETGDEAAGSGSPTTGTTIESGSFDLSFPPNTSVDTAGGASQIEITLDPTLPARVEVAGADLDGGTKSITMPFDGNASNPAVCIDDSPTASIDSILTGGSCAASKVLIAIPATVGASVTQSAYTVTRVSNTPAQVRVEGLSYTALATIGLGAPTVTSVTSASEPVEVGTSVSVSAEFFDSDGNTSTATIDWGDGNTSAGTVASSGSTASGNHTYAEPGVYTVGVTLADDDGNEGTGTYQFVVVYDPDGGFVTGGGWIDSPPGAYTADPDLTGRANFGFVAKYKKGANVPEGDTNFQFKAGDLHFTSSSYDWLVIAGQDKAKYKGTGAINGAGSYKFMLTAIDNGNSGDELHIKIWDDDGGGVIYDNRADSGDEEYAGTVIGGGNIKVHKK